MANTAWYLCYMCGNLVTEGYWLDFDDDDSIFYCRACAERRIANGTLQREWLRAQPEVSVDDISEP
jgi:hypothetical protein